jgi:anti-anti-sigma factor
MAAGASDRRHVPASRSVGSRPIVPSQFRLDVRSEDSGTVIGIAGELDLASSPALEESLERVFASGAPVVILDLRELDFMDSTGLSVLIRAHQTALDADRTLCLVKGPPQVQRLLSLTGVEDRLTVIDTPEDARGGG